MPTIVLITHTLALFVYYPISSSAVLSAGVLVTTITAVLVDLYSRLRYGRVEQLSCVLDMGMAIMSRRAGHGMEMMSHLALCYGSALSRSCSISQRLQAQAAVFSRNTANG